MDYSNYSIDQFLSMHKGDGWVQLISSAPYNVSVSEDKYYYLLKYNQIKSKVCNLVNDCRGIIIEKDTNSVVCRSFSRFFNYGEPNAANLDWNSVVATEKIDGSFIKGWWSEKLNKWMVSTNGVINAFEAEIQNDISPFKTFGGLFTQYFGLHTFKLLDKNYTYLFELVSPWNKIVVHYSEPDVYHLATRHTKSGKYINHDIGIKKPKQFPISSLNDIVKIANELPFDQEGYVVVDKYNKRLKVKSPAYVAMHHLKNNGVINKERILDLIKLGEDEEFVDYFPEFKNGVDDLRQKYNKLNNELNNCMKTYYEYETKFNKSEISRKEFAEWAKTTSLPALFFSLLDNKVNSVEEFLNSIKNDKIISFMEKII